MKTIEEGLILNDRYELKRFIGKGGFSQVWLAKDIQLLGSEVAIKIFVSNSGLTEEELETFRDEYENTRGLNDERLLTPSDQFDYGNSPCLVMPFMEGGSLENKIRKSGRLREEEIGQMIHQIAGGLHVLENHQILHNDIKPDNMLIDGAGNYHLADFGISAKMRNTFLRASRLRGETFNYRSPEKVQGNDVYAQSDIFSLGVTLYEVCKGVFPEGVSLGDNVIKGYPKPVIDTNYYSRRLEQLIHACLNRNPEDRPTAARLEAYAQQFIEHGYWDEIIEYIPEEEFARHTQVLTHSTKEYVNVPPASNYSSQPYPGDAPYVSYSESGNDSLRITIGILIVLVLCLGGYLIFDHFSEASHQQVMARTSASLPDRPATPEEPESNNLTSSSNNSSADKVAPIDMPPEIVEEPKVDRADEAKLSAKKPVDEKKSVQQESKVSAIPKNDEVTVPQPKASKKISKDENVDNQQSEISRFYGTWKCVIVESGITIQIFWTPRQDGTTQYKFITPEGTDYVNGGTWRYANGILYEEFPDGGSGRARVEWDGTDKFTLTIIDNGAPEQRGTKRVYRKI